ncbi:MAG: EmrB/QacA family drug resistance transporter, partial [Candidatus Acidiferrales bacterium]
MGMTTPVTVWIVSRMGVAFLFVPINVIAFYFVAPKKTNDATGIINLARNIGGSMGISFVTTLLDRGAQTHQNILSGHITALSNNFQAQMHALAQRLIAAGSSPTQALQQAERMFYGVIQQQAMMLSFIDDFRVMGYICLAMIPVMFILKKAKPGKSRVMAH